MNISASSGRPKMCILLPTGVRTGPPYGAAAVIATRSPTLVDTGMLYNSNKHVHSKCAHSRACLECTWLIVSSCSWCDYNSPLERRFHGFDVDR